MNDLQREFGAFIKDAVREGRVFWTYHVNMRLRQRDIPSREIVEAVDTFVVIEVYPPERRLPCALVLGHGPERAFHVVFALDREDGNVRVVTAYRPDPEEWNETLKRRRSTR